MNPIISIETCADKLFPRCFRQIREHDVKKRKYLVDSRICRKEIQVLAAFWIPNLHIFRFCKDNWNGMITVTCTELFLLIPRCFKTSSESDTLSRNAQWSLCSFTRQNTPSRHPIDIYTQNIRLDYEHNDNSNEINTRVRPKNSLNGQAPKRGAQRNSWWKIHAIIKIA